MNKQYKVIWNKLRKTFVVVGENGKSNGKSKSKLSLSGEVLSTNIGALCVGATLVFSPASAFAANVNWNAATGDWLTGSNWDVNTVPQSVDNAFIDNAGTAQVTTGNSEVRNVYIGDLQNGNLMIQNGSNLTVASGYIANQAGSNGSVTVDGNGSIWNNTIQLQVGLDGVGASLFITNGGVVNSEATNVGYSSGSGGAINVDGVGSTLNTNTALYVGLTGTGTLDITNGAVVNNVESGYVGENFGSNGTVTVSGADSAWNNTAGNLFVGNKGQALLEIQNGGAVENQNAYIGRGSSGDGRVSVDGTNSNWINHNTLSVGFYGDGELDITNGGYVSNTSGFVGLRAGSQGVVVVDGAGSSWHSVDGLYVGRTGDGALTISNNGAVDVKFGAAALNIGVDAGSVGVVNIGSAIGDAEVGAGVLNASNVTFGAGTGSLVFNHTNPSYVFSQDIIGNGSVVSHAGSTQLTGDLAGYGGDITIESLSTLALNPGNGGYVVAGDVLGGGNLALNAGEMRFTGDLSNFVGNLTVQGATLAINSGESLAIGGDYTQASTGVLKLGVGNDTNYGKLIVAGTATLPSNAQIDIDVADPNFSFSASSLDNIISAGTLVSDGTFQVTENSALFNMYAVKDGNTVDLTLTSVAAEEEAAALAEQEEAEQLQQEADEQEAAAQTAIEQEAAAQAQQAAAAQLVAAQAAVAASAIGVAQKAVINNSTTGGVGAAAVVDQFIASFANDPAGNEAIESVVTDFNAVGAGKNLADAVESTLPAVTGGIAQLTNISTNVVTDIVAVRQDISRGLSSGDDFMTNGHVWFKPFGGWTEQNNTQGVTGYDIQSHGLAIGADGDVSAALNVGIAFTYMNSDVDSKLASGMHTVDMDTYMAKLYATQMFDNGLALNLQVGGGISNYDSQRRLFNGETAVADYKSWHAQLSAELERTYQISDVLALTPFISADYAYVDVDRYTESEAGALNLTVGDDSADSFVIGVGVKGKYAMTDKLTLSGHAGIGYDAMTDRTRVTAAYAGGGATFSTNGIRPDETVYQTGLNLKYSLDDGSEMTASYTMDARQGYTDQSASLNIRILF